MGFKMRLTAAVGFVLLSLGCGTNKEMVYFQGLSDSTVIDSVYWRQVRINKGDQLSITIASLNGEIDNVINKANSSSINGNSAETQNGYFVTETGFLNLPRIGNFYVEGMTHAILVDTLQRLYSAYTKNPVVAVRLMNFRITVLGEVNRPGQITFSTPNIDIYQAIGKAGDITTHGKRSNVILIRQTDSSRIVRRIDLTSPMIIRSDFFQLQSGDLVYVEANQTKKNSNSLTFQIWPLISSGLSLAISILIVLTR